MIHDEALIDIPLSIVAPATAVVVLAAPVLAALAAIAALVKEYTIEIEKVEDRDWRIFLFVFCLHNPHTAKRGSPNLKRVAYASRAGLRAFSL